MRNGGPLLGSVYAAGHLPFAWSAPNGYPDSRDYWVGFLLPRWNFAANLSQRRSGIDLELPFLEPSLSPAEIAKRIDRHLLDGTLSEVSRLAIEQFVAAAGRVDRKTLLDAVGLALSSPEFQDY